MSCFGYANFFSCSVCDSYVPSFSVETLTIHRYLKQLLLVTEMTEDSSDSDTAAWVKDPYCDDPVWEPWHANAIDVKGGADDDTGTSSEDEIKSAGVFVGSLPENCVCQNCRNVHNN
jgi:hypothetical protein